MLGWLCYFAIYLIISNELTRSEHPTPSCYCSSAAILQRYSRFLDERHGLRYLCVDGRWTAHPGTSSDLLQQRVHFLPKTKPKNTTHCYPTKFKPQELSSSLRLWHCCSLYAMAHPKTSSATSISHVNMISQVDSAKYGLCSSRSIIIDLALECIYSNIYKTPGPIGEPNS